MLERRNRRCDPVVGETGRHGHHRQTADAGGVLGDVERPPAADGDDRVVEALPQLLCQLHRGLDGSVLDHPDVGVLQLRSQDRGDLLALPRPDGDRHVPAARDPSVGEQRRKAGDRPGPDVDRKRRADHAGQQRHATSRARARSA